MAISGGITVNQLVKYSLELIASLVLQLMNISALINVTSCHNIILPWTALTQASTHARTHAHTHTPTHTHTNTHTLTHTHTHTGACAHTHAYTPTKTKLPLVILH